MRLGFEEMSGVTSDQFSPLTLFTIIELIWMLNATLLVASNNFSFIRGTQTTVYTWVFTPPSIVNAIHIKAQTLAVNHSDQSHQAYPGIQHSLQTEDTRTV